MAHLSDAEVSGLLGGRLEGEACQRAMRHLLGGCEKCRERLFASSPEMFCDDGVFEEETGQEREAAAGSPDAYDLAIERALASVQDHQSAYEKEKKRLARALVLLRDSPSPNTGRGTLTPRQERANRGRPLVEALLQLSYEARFRDPWTMRWLAFEARVEAESMDPAEHPAGSVFDLQARAWIELANAYRVTEEYDLAEGALACAGDLCQQGTGDLLVLARLANVHASLRQAQRRFTEACDFLNEVCQLYLDLGESHLAGRALISRGGCLRTAGEPQEALRCLQEGLLLLDRERDPELVSVADQALLDAMVDCGDYRKAGKLLLKSGLRQAFASDPLNLLRLRWVEGKILAGLGKLERAEGVFQEVRHGFQERGLEYDAALAGLDLAAVWLQMSEVSQVLPLAQEMLDTFQELGIHREAVKALRCFHLACSEKAVTAELVTGVRAFLARLQSEPHLRFEPNSLVV